MVSMTITDEAFDSLNKFGEVVVIDDPPGCSHRPYRSEVLEVLAGSLPPCSLTVSMLLNGRKMLVYVHVQSCEGMECACCRWSRVTFEKVA